MTKLKIISKDLGLQFLLLKGRNYFSNARMIFSFEKKNIPSKKIKDKDFRNYTI